MKDHQGSLGKLPGALQWKGKVQKQWIKFSREVCGAQSQNFFGMPNGHCADVELGYLSAPLLLQWRGARLPIRLGPQLLFSACVRNPPPELSMSSTWLDFHISLQGRALCSIVLFAFQSSCRAAAAAAASLPRTAWWCLFLAGCGSCSGAGEALPPSLYSVRESCN